MEILRTISSLGEIKKGCVLTIGNFDGVHIGHQEILATAKRTAEQRSAELVVMTFAPHPVVILHPERAPGVLTPLELKKRLLVEYGIDYLLVLETNSELINLSPTDFSERFLVKGIQPSVIVEGKDFNFGYGRAGSIDTLQKLGCQRNFEVIVVDGKEVKFLTGRIAKISSTMIRYMLTEGKVAEAAVALGRSYRLIGRVVPGRGKGKQLGFPTANMEPAQQVIPEEGVYAGFAGVGNNEQQVCSVGVKIPAVFSIGRAETYSNKNPLLIESHMLAGDVGSLHGKWLAIDFVKYIRSQITFETETDLAAQIAKDREKAKEVLATKGVKK